MTVKNSDDAKVNQKMHALSLSAPYRFYKLSKHTSVHAEICTASAAKHDKM